MSRKILRHTDKEEIISRLTSGESVKSVERWLRKKYPKKRRFHVSYVTLQSFRKTHLNIQGEVLDEIKKARSDHNVNKSELETRAKILASDAYQKKLAEIVDNEIDVTRKIVEMETLISSRMEFYFNTLANGGGIKEEKMFLELLNSQRALMADWKKYVERVADKTIDHNVNITVVNEQITVLKGIVYEVLRELDPSVIPLFVEKVQARLDSTDYLNDRYLKQIEVDVD